MVIKEHQENYEPTSFQALHSQIPTKGFILFPYFPNLHNLFKIPNEI